MSEFRPIDYAELHRIAFGPPGPGAAPAPPPRAKCTAHSKRTGKPCGHYPVPGATVCKWHGGAAPQVIAAAERRLQEQRAAEAVEAARKRIGGIDLSQYADPLDALEFALSYTHALAQRPAKAVEALPDDQLRYQGRISEQLRGEVIAAQTALRDLRQGAVDAAKLGLAERRVAIREQTAVMLERALDATLAKAGLDLNAQASARETFRANLKVITGGLAEDAD